MRILLIYIKTGGDMTRQNTSETPTFSCDFTTGEVSGNVDFHMHNNHELYMLLDGEIQYFVDNICYPLHAGDLILFSNHEIHKAINTSDQAFTRLVIHVNPGFIRQYCTLQTNLLSCFHRSPGTGNLVLLTPEERQSLLTLARPLADAVNSATAYGDDLTALTNLIQILLLINKAWQRTGPVRTAPKPHRVQAIMDYIDQNLTAPLTLDSIAEALALDKYYISHLFKSETESSIFQYILIKRISLAKELLLTGHTVEESCHLSGFHDYSNFIRTFRKNVGCTPGQFQRQLR